MTNWIKMNIPTIITEEYDKILIEDFIEEVERYQSNHYGNYDRNRLADTYHALPEYFKKAIFPSSSFKDYWRGADGVSGDYGAISFTDKQPNAAFYGTFAFPFKEIKSYRGLIDTGRLRRFIDKYRIPSDVGDDENEIIVIDPVWNEAMQNHDYQERYRYSRL